MGISQTFTKKDILHSKSIKVCGDKFQANKIASMENTVAVLDTIIDKTRKFSLGLSGISFLVQYLSSNQLISILELSGVILIYLGQLC